MIEKYRRKKIVKAVQLKNTKASFKECYKFIGKLCLFGEATDGTFINLKPWYAKKEQVRVGDWIVKEGKNELAVWSPDVFKRIYKAVK